MKRIYIAPIVESVEPTDPIMFEEYSTGMKGSAGDDSFGDGGWAPGEGDEADSKHQNLWDDWDD